MGRQIGRRLIEANPYLVDDMVRTAKFVRMMQNALGQRDFDLEVHKEGISNIISDCSQQVFTGELCKQYESFFKGMVSAINPEYELTYHKMITQGDVHCHWTLTRKSTSKEHEDPLILLKMKFVNGEITEDEYRHKKKVLEE